MRSKKGPDGQETGRTFIETARRAQIVAAAIDTIAELGYGQASLARIAEAAGTSKGVIMYHFGDKDELIRKIIAELVARTSAYMRPLVEAEQAGAAMLRVYIESSLAFMAANRNHVLAAVEIALGARAADGGRLFGTAFHNASVTAAEQLLAHFQGTGEFRAGFDPRVMAITIRAAIDSVAPMLAGNPGLDVAHHARELADLFDRATRPEAASQPA
jgi:TetR/AcrR family fatty acid metabolism transcriptional regulator